MSQTIKVAIAEDHVLFSNILADHIDEYDQLEVVLNVSNGQELLNYMENKRVDVILLDLDMPIVDGRKAMHIIRKKYGSAIGIIILSMYYEDIVIRKYLKAGANSFLPKECDIDDLAEAIKEVHHSGVYLHRKVSQELMDELQSDQSTIISAALGDPLSDTELEIIRLLCQGNSSKEIAEKLRRSEKTIKNHRFRISQKLDIHNPMLLMEYAIAHGIHKMNI